MANILKWADKGSPLNGAEYDTNNANINAALGQGVPQTTKGDIGVHNGTTNVRLPVGSTFGQSLFVNSAQATGLEYKDAVQVVNDIATLRTINPVNTVIIRTKCHTTLGDGGHGFWRGVTGASAGTYTHNNGTIVVPSGGDGGAAWLREDAWGRFRNAAWFGVIGDQSTDILSAIQAAIDSLPAIGGEILIPHPGAGNYYVCSGAWSIPSGKNNFYIHGQCKYTQIRFTSTTANAITISGEHDNLILENLDLYAPNNSTGTAISSTITGSATPLRDFEFRNVNIAGFLKGIVVFGHLNGRIVGGRQSGQNSESTNVAGGVGIQLGDSSSYAGNGCIIDGVYVSSYETEIYNKYATPTALRSCTIGGGSVAGTFGTGLRIDAPGIVYAEGLYFDRLYVAINNSGYLNWSGHLSTLNALSITTNKRYRRTGYNQARINVYRGTSNQATIATNTYTKIQFNAEAEDSEGWFDSATNYRFTVSFAGWHRANVAVRFRAGTASKPFHAAIYKNGAVIAENRVWGPSIVPDQVGVTSSTLVWLEKNDYIEGYCYHEEGVNSEIYLGVEKTFMTVTSE